jgi:hypothetical protein
LLGRLRDQRVRYLPRGRSRIWSARDWPSDDDDVRTRSHRIGRRHDAALIRKVSARRADTGYDRHKIATAMRADHRHFVRAANDAIKTGSLRQHSEARNLIGCRRLLSNGSKHAVVHAGENRHADDFDICIDSPRSFSGSAHHLLTTRCVDIEYRCAEMRESLRGASHGVWNVMEFHVGKYRRTGRDHCAHGIRA